MLCMYLRMYVTYFIFHLISFTIFYENLRINLATQIERIIRVAFREGVYIYI